jgi:hypothetical protein
MGVVRRGLVIPGHLSRIDVHGHERAREEVVPRPHARSIGRRGISGPDDVQVSLGIVRARRPEIAAAVARRFEAGPGVESGIAGIHGRRIELPLHCAGFGVERTQEPRLVRVVAAADEHMVADDDGGCLGEILFREMRGLLVPAFLAGARVERHEIVIGRLHEQPIAVDAQSLVGGVRTSFRFPVVVPQHGTGPGVDGPGVVGRGGVQNPVNLQNGAAHADGRPGREETTGNHRLGGLAAHDLRRPGGCEHPTAARIQPTSDVSRPRQGEILDVVSRDLSECAIAPARIVAGVRRPGVRERGRHRWRQGRLRSLGHGQHRK